MARKAVKVPEFGAWLDHQIRSRGWNLSDFARETGASPSMVSKWTRGTQPSTQSVDKIAEALHADPDIVLTIAGHRPATIPIDPDSATARLMPLIEQIDWETNPERLPALESQLRTFLEWDRKNKSKT